MKDIIKELWSVRDTLNENSFKEPEIKKAILDVIDQLNSGNIRVAHKQDKSWIVNDWVKKAILLYTQVTKKYVSNECGYRYFDKIPLKFQAWDEGQFENTKMRVSPGTIVRKGAFIANETDINPSFIDIGTHIGKKSKIDTYSNIGACVQIGERCHIGSFVGIEGSLNSIYAKPAIIEDNCFISSKCEIGEGVVIREGSILAMGVNIDKSTKIYDRETEEIFYGEVPEYSVVVPGVMPNENGTLFLYSAIIVKRVDEVVREKKSIDEILREYK